MAGKFLKCKVCDHGELVRTTVRRHGPMFTAIGCASGVVGLLNGLAGVVVWAETIYGGGSFFSSVNSVAWITSAFVLLAIGVYLAGDYRALVCDNCDAMIPAA